MCSDNGIFDGTGRLAHRVNGVRRRSMFSLPYKPWKSLLLHFSQIFSSVPQPIFVHSNSPVSSLVARLSTRTD